MRRLGSLEQRFNITFSLAEVTDNLDQLRFLAGYDDKITHEEEVTLLQASKIMANLFTAMTGDDVDADVADEAPTNLEDVQRTSGFFTRLLSLLFGDDVCLWEQELFYRFSLERVTSENLDDQLDALFDVLSTPESKCYRVHGSMAAFSTPTAHRLTITAGCPPPRFLASRCGILSSVPAGFTGRTFRRRSLAACSSW